MTKTSHTLTNARRDITKKKPTATGFTTVPDGYELCDITLTVDMEALARALAGKAMKNKLGRSAIAWGCCVAKVTKRNRVNKQDA